MSKLIYVIQAACFLGIMYMLGGIYFAGNALTPQQFGSGIFASLLLFLVGVGVSVLHPRTRV